MNLDHAFYVGPIGSMLPLPDVYSPTTVGVTRLGGSSQSLEGRQWRDTLGYLRTWQWRWANLLPAQIPYVEALTYGMVRGPLRLIDPRRTNRLPEQMASGGSRSRSTDGFAVTAGGLIYRDLRSTPTDLTTLPPAAMLRGCQEWQRSVGGASTCYLTGNGADGTWRLPLIPDGANLELSCWVAGAAGVPVELQWTEYERDDTARPYRYSAVGSDDVVLSATVWQRVSTVINPALRPAAVAATPRLTTPDGSPAGAVLHTAWQIAEVGAEDIADGGWSGDCGALELAGGWRIGGGAPVVVVDPDAVAYGRPPFRDMGLVLVET